MDKKSHGLECAVADKLCVYLNDQQAHSNKAFPTPAFLVHKEKMALPMKYTAAVLKTSFCYSQSLPLFWMSCQVFDCCISSYWQIVYRDDPGEAFMAGGWKGIDIEKSPLQKLGFSKLGELSSHLGDVFGVSVTLWRQFDVIFGNLFPLSPGKLGKLTFLQGTLLRNNGRNNWWKDDRLKDEGEKKER